MDNNLISKDKDRKKYLDKEGNVVYEWTQSLDEINIFIKLPSPSIKRMDLNINILPSRLSVGLVGNPYYIDHELWSTIDPNESLWYLAEGEICIECNKVKKGEVWLGVFKNHGVLDPFVQQEVQKKMMLERFQEEHPEFDFSNAKFTGSAPDPRTFMGGISYK